MHHLRRRPTLIALAAVLALALSTAATGQVPDGPIRLQGSFVTLTDAGVATNHVLEITIDKYSSSNDRIELVDAMIKGGQDAARSRMQRMAFKGRMRVPDWTGPD